MSNVWICIKGIEMNEKKLKIFVWANFGGWEGQYISVVAYSKKEALNLIPDDEKSFYTKGKGIQFKVMELDSPKIIDDFDWTD